MPGHPHFRQASRLLQDSAPPARRRVEAALRPYLVDAPLRRAVAPPGRAQTRKQPDGLLRLPTGDRD